MRSRWSEDEAQKFLSTYAGIFGEDLASRTYTSRLLGQEPALVLHGGGNTSVKSTIATILGEYVPAIFVKASGRDMAAIEPDGHTAVDLTHLRRLRSVAELTDEAMFNELRTHLFDHTAQTPSLETMVHAFLPQKFVDHTHADAILTLTNQTDGEKHVLSALGDDVIVLDYVTPGFKLARAVADAFEARPACGAMVWLLHGIVTWGETARESYETMIELVTRAEQYVRSRATRRSQVSVVTAVPAAVEHVTVAAPMLRGLLARHGGTDTTVRQPSVVRPLVTAEVLEFVDSSNGHVLSQSAPLTSDHLIRTGSFPLWIASPKYDDLETLRTQLAAAVNDYAGQQMARQRRHATAHVTPEMFNPLPRVVLMPGLGALCVGPDAAAAAVARDITEHTLAVKRNVAAMGVYRGLGEAECFAMEFRLFQQAKVQRRETPLGGHVAIVTGAAGAIGSGICQLLLENGCHVAVTDLPGARLDTLVSEQAAHFDQNVVGVPLDVTDPASVAEAFRTVVQTWGGVDLVVINAGLAHVASLAEIDLETFRRLERVNVEGTLLVLAEASRHFTRQACGGDVVLVSTKNVFAPGARFGAYSATKAASHQLARIASLELSELDVRVNMVSPDAVFSHGDRKSGLWAEVGPDRMKARGLNEAGLEQYYQNRNLLKARVSAEHVARAVLFFATRQTPTTGATIPVDGGLPDATPR